MAGLIAETEKQTSELERRLEVIREESPKGKSKERRVRMADDEENENVF